jgi:hypothetical protein
MGFLRSRRLLVVGVCILVTGYLLLLAGDRLGRNLASHMAPFLIVGGIALSAWDALRKE